ncbi:MAG TPA: hypothetical protein VGR41_02630 [Actinomycetota bacterium]|jgi:hypothetical protein|nr:hypothetical protein [Actinomycetota bacterium]
MGEEHGQIYGSSRRFVLAQLDENYVIWDLRDSGDEPAETYPATEDGFERANARFTMLVRQDRMRRLRLFAALRWTVLVGVIVWAVSNAIYYAFLDSAIFEQVGFVDLFRRSGAIAYHLWIGALAVLAALWLERRLREPTLGGGPTSLDKAREPSER